MFQQAFVALPNSAQVFDLISRYEQVIVIFYCCFCVIFLFVDFLWQSCQG